MKRIVCLVLLSMMILFSATAEDYASMTDTELNEVLVAVQNELARREAYTREDQIIYDDGSIVIVWRGSPYIKQYSDTYVFYTFDVINNSDRGISFQTKDIRVNNWKTSCTGASSVEEKTSFKNSVGLTISDAYISTMEEIKDISFVLELISADDWVVISDSPIHLSFSDR